MKIYNKYISDIIEAKNNGTLAIFVGAGVSKCANNNLPTWNEIINSLKNELNEKNENDFSKIAQLYYMKFGEFVYLKKIQEFFPDLDITSNVHKLIFDINPDVIITTNFDNLLEKTIEKNSYNYDIIRCDDDLVKSFLPKKLIKMHGDFEKNNIVFKEDDYLNYQYNFPLIENYIKSILSTHSILFLGYSYSDIDLKQIIMWLKNFSKVQPPKYLTVINDDPNQTKYLKNHGIYTINLNKLNKGNESKINNKNEPSFKDKYENILNLIKNEDKFNLIKENNDPIEFVYNKLKIYEHFNYILQDHIQETLTNCGFIYEDEKTILEFYNQELTHDINKEVRDIYQDFLKEINNKFENNEINDTINKIFEILKKANIDGIFINENKYIPIQENKDSFIESILNFDFENIQLDEDDDYYLLKKSFIQYQIQNYVLAYHYNEEALKNYLKHKNYFLYYISIFNKRTLIFLINKKFNNLEYDVLNLLDNEYNKLPNILKKILKPIYNFFNYNYLFEIYYRISEELKNKENSKHSIKSGGYIWRKNSTFSNSVHKNIIYFIIGNSIIIENYSEFKNLIEKFLKISIISQTFNQVTEFNKIELHSAIKYIKYNELLKIFNEFYEGDNNNKIKKFQISDENKSWLINIVFKNVVQYYINAYNIKDIFAGYETYLQNTIFFLSLLELNSEESNLILKDFKEIIESKNISLNIYQAINKFFDCQYKLYKNKLDSHLLLNLINTIINNFINSQYKGPNYIVVTNPFIDKLFLYAKFNDVIIKDVRLIELLLDKCENILVDKKIDISKNLLLYIYDISTKLIKNKIENFILNIPVETIDDKGKYLIFKFSLIERNLIKLDKQIISDLDEYLKQFENLKTFSSYLKNINDYLDYLIEKMNYKELLPASQKVKNLIEKYNKNKPESIF